MEEEEEVEEVEEFLWHKNSPEVSLIERNDEDVEQPLSVSCQSTFRAEFITFSYHSIHSAIDWLAGLLTSLISWLSADFTWPKRHWLTGGIERCWKPIKIDGVQFICTEWNPIWQRRMTCKSDSGMDGLNWRTTAKSSTNCQLFFFFCGFF